MKTDLQITLDNLQIVLNELPTLAEKMPEIKEEFDMSTFGCFEHSTFTNKNYCSTYGCLLGNIARVLPIFDEHYDSLQSFDYSEFGFHYFPYLYTNRNKHLSNDKWYFLFDSAWSIYQPTFDQAIERIKYFIYCEGSFTWKYQEESFVKP